MVLLADSMMFMLPDHKSNPTDLHLWELVYEETNAYGCHVREYGSCPPSLCSNAAQELEPSPGKIMFDLIFSGCSTGKATPLVSGVILSKVLRLGVADSCKYLPALEFVNQVLLDMHIVL